MGLYDMFRSRQRSHWHQKEKKNKKNKCSVFVIVPLMNRMCILLIPVICVPIWKIVISSIEKPKLWSFLLIQFVVKSTNIIQLDVPISTHNTSTGDEDLQDIPDEHRGVYFWTTSAAARPRCRRLNRVINRTVAVQLTIMHVIAVAKLVTINAST